MCHRRILAELSLPPPGFNKDIELTARSILPSVNDDGAPAHTPADIASYYAQGVACLQVQSWDAAGAMFRKAVERGLRERFESTKRGLYHLIEGARTLQQITPELADWAHQIRLDGNEAVHGHLFTETEATRLGAFTKLLLQYIFYLPGELKAARAPKETDTNDGSSEHSDKSGAAKPSETSAQQE